MGSVELISLEWIKEFLTDRTQQVVIENKFSDSTPVISGVPQGSVLGPLIFLLFINDLPCGIDSVVKLYADDVIMYRSIKDSSDHHALQSDLDKLAHWSTIWQMLSFFRRNFGQCTQDIKTKCYLTYIRPIRICRSHLVTPLTH